MTWVSKRDWWLLAVIWGTALMLLGTLAIAISRSEWTSALFLSALVGLLLWVVYGTSYSIGDGLLRIRSGPFRWKIPVESIISVTATDDPTSSPACSLDRLAIRYGNGVDYILVSPLDKEGFVNELRRACPQLRES